MIKVKFYFLSGKVVGINHKSLFTDSVWELELCSPRSGRSRPPET